MPQLAQPGRGYNPAACIRYHTNPDDQMNFGVGHWDSLVSALARAVFTECIVASDFDQVEARWEAHTLTASFLKQKLRMAGSHGDHPLINCL